MGSRCPSPRCHEAQAVAPCCSTRRDGGQGLFEALLHIGVFVVHPCRVQLRPYFGPGRGAADLQRAVIVVEAFRAPLDAPRIVIDGEPGVALDQLSIGHPGGGVYLLPIPGSAEIMPAK
jgi:hypothetical protein